MEEAVVGEEREQRASSSSGSNGSSSSAGAAGVGSGVGGGSIGRWGVAALALRPAMTAPPLV